jgi:PhnB protein
MKVNPYLFFDGTCEQALKFYADVLGAKIEALMAYKDMPDDDRTPPEWKNKIMHGRISLGDQVIMASDASPGHYNKPQGFDVTLNFDKPEEAEKVFKALSDGARNISMPLGETFWAQRFGAFTDKFGTPWMINCEKKM